MAKCMPTDPSSYTHGRSRWGRPVNFILMFISFLSFFNVCSSLSIEMPTCIGGHSLWSKVWDWIYQEGAVDLWHYVRPLARHVCSRQNRSGQWQMTTDIVFLSVTGYWSRPGTLSVSVALRTISRSRISSGSIVSDCGLDDRGSMSGRGKGFFLYPLRPDRLWGPPSLLYNGYRGYFPPGVKRFWGPTCSSLS
jgi:hypothetical protein